MDGNSHWMLGLDVDDKCCLDFLDVLLEMRWTRSECLNWNAICILEISDSVIDLKLFVFLIYLLYILAYTCAYFAIFIHMSARQNQPPTFWNSYTRTLILDTIMKLSGTIGVTQKTMTLDTHVRLILLQTLNPQERWGTHKKRWPFQPRLFADVIGLVRCSYEIYTYIYILHNSIFIP